MEFQVVERARQKVDKEAADAHQAHCRIVAKCRRCAEWTAALQARNLRLEMLPGRVGPGAGAGIRYFLHQAKEQAQKLLVLEVSAKAEALLLLHAMKERAGEEARLATEVGNLQLMGAHDPREDFLEVSRWGTEAQAVKTSTTLDSDSVRKIPRARAHAKSRQKSHTGNCGKAQLKSGSRARSSLPKSLLQKS